MDQIQTQKNYTFIKKLRIPIKLLRLIEKDFQTPISFFSRLQNEESFCFSPK